MSAEAVKEALTMRIKDRNKKYVFAYGQKVKVDGDVYDTEGVTKAQVLVLKGRKGEKVLSKKEEKDFERDTPRDLSICQFSLINPHHPLSILFDTKGMQRL